MNIPNKIRIGACNYEVSIADQKLCIDGEQKVGIIDYMNHEIKIDSSCQDIQSIEETFLHEVIHGIIKERRLEFEDEELVCDRFAIALQQIARDNPKMFEPK